MRLRFSDCLLDIAARQLYRRERPVPLSPKAFDLLTLLIEQRPRAVSKDELLDHVWADVMVAPASLTRAVSEIRQAVGDRTKPYQIVRTVHGAGYAFAAPVEDDANRPPPSARAPRCWLTCQGREFLLPSGEHIVGRDPGLTIWLDSPKVSRHHARVLVRGGQATVEDLNSKNGTFVGGGRISAPVTLAHGDTVIVGSFKLVFHLSAGLPATETETG